MIKIVRIYRSALAIEKARVAQVQQIFRKNFSAVADYADKIPDMLNEPIKYGYTSVLLVSESSAGVVTGFSLVLYFPNIKSAFLDFMAVNPDIHGGGIGGALYEASREYLKQRNISTLFMEALPDDGAVVKDAGLLKENKRRLKFYESYGVRPIIGTEYETPVDDSPAPYMLYDGLDTGKPLKRSLCRAAFRTILTKKYSHLVSEDYIERVVESVIDDPVKIREPKYIKKAIEKTAAAGRLRLERIFSICYSTVHEIHHIHERGYVERPARVKVLAGALDATGLFDIVKVKHFSQEHILAVHDIDFVRYLKAVCSKLDSKRPVYPYVFPIRRPEKKPKDLAVRAGYYCIDTFTPLDKNAYDAACAAVDTALTGAEQLLKSKPAAYSLCRPPGHHAEKRAFGGFCYFNNAAIAANFLSARGKTATLDIDFHHGNGTQSIFYSRDDVLTVSIHGHPNIAYPYFSGFADETGEGKGLGFNINYPLGENIGEQAYISVLEKALDKIKKFAPDFLVLSLGFDIIKGDPTGSFALTVESMRKIAVLIASLNMPTLVVQEGGYNLRNLKIGAAAFFNGFAEKLINV